MPCTPVQALALPELATIARNSPLRRWDCETRTGAAFTRLVVKVPAEAQGFSSVVQQGMTVIVLLGFGVSVSAFGSGAWLVLSAFCLLGVILPLISLRLQPKHD